MYEIIGIESVARAATYSHREVSGITIHCYDHDSKIKEGIAVRKFFFPNRPGKSNRAAKLTLGDFIDTVFYDVDKYPVSYDLFEDSSK